MKFDDFFGQFHSGAKYLAIPNKVNPRVLLPLINYNVFTCGLKIHNTSSWKNKIIKWFIPYVYPFKFFLPNIVRSSSSFNEFCAIVQDQLSFEFTPVYSVYIGTPKSSNQKFTFQLMDNSGEVLGFVKSSMAVKSKDFLLNEVKVLDKLNASFDERLIIPKCKVYEKDIFFVYYENIYKNESKSIYKINREICDICILINQKNFLNNNFNAKIKELIAEIKLIVNSDMFSFISDELNKLIKHNLPTILAHGDFVPYNLKYYDSKFYVIDWEFADFEGALLFDLFAFNFQIYTQIEKKSASHAVQKMTDTKHEIYKYYEYYLKKFNYDSLIIIPLLVYFLAKNIILSKRNRLDFCLEKNHYHGGLIEARSLLGSYN